MKKSLLIASLMAATSMATYGQGQVHFSNYSSSTAPQVTDVGPGQGFTLGAGYSAQLLYAIGSAATSSALTPLAFNDGTGDVSPVAFGLAGGDPNGSAFAGWFEGGVVTIPGVTSTSGTYSTTFAVLVLKAGVPYEVSSLFAGSVTKFASDTAPDMFPNSDSATYTLLVPEPTSMALLGLGAASMMIIRRRK